jgi:hypothetical protein
MKVIFEGTLSQVILQAAEFAQQSTLALPPQLKVVEPAAREKHHGAPPRASRRRESPSQAEAIPGTNVSPASPQPPVYTIEDATKAASLHAAMTTPNTVKDILEQFGTSNLADLEDGQRHEFVDMLMTPKARAKRGKK